jgi:mRNA interferase RelE/StbE
MTFSASVNLVHEVHLEKRAQRDLRHLPTAVSNRAIESIKALAQNPRPPGCRKIVGSKSDWRVRVGDYRIVYEIDDVTKAVRIMYVRHRRDAYR